MDALDLRSEVVRNVLESLGRSGGWAVLKGWADLPRITGDLDLIVEPALVEPHADVVVEAIRPFADGGFIAWCEHIPRVPRVLAHLPSHGFASEIFEVDLAHVLPIRSAPLITMARVEDLVEFVDGYPRTTRAADAAITFLTKTLGWWTASAPIPDGSGAAIEALVGPRRARLASRAHLRRRAAFALTASLLAQSVLTPSQLLERAAWRLRPSRCPFDPRAGRGSRSLGSMTAEDVVASGHRLL